MAANGLASDYIFAGQRLVIPLNPVPPSTPATPAPTPNYGCKYTVQPHDTIYNIAYRYQIPYASLMQANFSYSPYMYYGYPYIYVGQQLNVPCVTATPTPFPTYVIQSGDNLFRIAIQYSTTIYSIARVNGIWNPNWVWAGQNIVVPYPGSYVWPTGIPTRIPTSTATATIPGSATVTPTPTATATLPANTGVVNLQFNTYIPNVITVTVGTTVVWKNLDGINHTVSSGTPGSLDYKFRSPLLAPNQTFSFTFNNAGTYPYFDEIIGAPMTGTVVVQ
jgi:LysM repeat protein